MKRFIWAALALLLLLAADITYRLLPLVHKSETYLSFFPKERFLSKMAEPTPAWMQAQIDRDFASLPPITFEAVEETYQTIYRRIGNSIYHYRILDNVLYKYIPRMRDYSAKDTPLEKALKTLLLTTRLPDLDFVLCPMDGIPEAYLPADYYKTAQQAPIIAKAKLKDADPIILIPDQFSLSDDWYNVSGEVLTLNDALPWHSKRNQAVWRGTLTDTGERDHIAGPYDQSPRYALCRLSQLFPHLIDAAFLACGAPENIEALQRENLLKGPLSKHMHLLCKYQPVMDGHMCTYPGYQWRLLSNSVAFKQTSDQVQWFYGALQPYVHYVPIANDLSDFLDQLEWAQSHDTELQAISERARTFASQNLLLEDNYKYLALVLQRYGRAQHIDFTVLRDETLRDPKWKCIHYRSRLRLQKMMDKHYRQFFGSQKPKAKSR